MKFTKEEINLEKGLQKEWIITNGIGGYSSSTIIGANTRKYHGLLIAPLNPPAKRYMVLSKLDESIQIDDKNFDLYTNIGENYISQGFKYQTSFDNDSIPTYKYNVGKIKISKQICMEYGKNVVGVYYKIKNTNKPITFKIAPIVNFRDFHSMSINQDFNLEQKITGSKVKLVIDNNKNVPICFKLSEGKYIEHKNDTFRDMFYIEEEKRGFYPKENHSVTGVYEVKIKPNELKELSFIFEVNEKKYDIKNADIKNIIKKEKARIAKNVKETKLLDLYKGTEKQEIVNTLVKAADQFVVFRPSSKLHTVIAGYPWFLDWGRDTLISFEGLFLKTNRFKLAQEILLTMVKDIKDGLVPNGYAEDDNRPLYNSVDSSLLLFEQVKKYLNYTNDYKFIKENIFKKLEDIIENYAKGIDLDDNNIYLDSDGLIVSGTINTQNTWMDAKWGDIIATPRNGKAVEINSLWYNSLMIISEIAEEIGEKDNIKTYKQLAKKCKTEFNNKFYNIKRKCLYDVLGDSKIRPNQLFALSLTYPIIDPNSDKGQNIIDTVEKKLLNNYGLKTLAKGEDGYIDVYEGDSFKRDMTYHQGTTWVWLLGLYYDSLNNMLKSEKRKTYKTKIENKIKEFKTQIEKTYAKEINERGCIGSIAEIYDSKSPYAPKGTIAQAWSVSEILRIIL